MVEKSNPGQPRRVALLGAGYISKFHAEALRSVPGVQLCAVCDADLGRASALAKAYAVPKSYGNLATMLTEEKLDAVQVLLPPAAHAEVISSILQAGVNVLTEKPLCISASDCRTLGAEAAKLGLLLGVGNNFLFSPRYERLLADFRQGRLGRVDQIDIVWNKELGQLKGGPFGGWLFAHPANVLFEVGPHSFTHLVHLAGAPDRLHVLTRDPVRLPSGQDFFRHWEVAGEAGRAGVRLHFSFNDGYTEHYIRVRGSSAAACVDFEQDSYVRQEHSPHLLDVDRYVSSTSAAKALATQAAETLGVFVLSKLRVLREGAPFQRSITRCVRAFYDGLARGELDERLGATLAAQAIDVAERVRESAERAWESAAVAASPALSALPDSQPARESHAAAPHEPRSSAQVLVIGGTGFIGQALVARLLEAGASVRLLARNPANVPPALKALPIEIVRGDLLDIASVEGALDGITAIYHLARGTGETWEDYLRTDVEPTRRLAQLCVARGIRRLYYTSSIAIYYAGARTGDITESTPPHPGVLRTNVYARAKVEIEKLLLDMHRERGLGVVIFRPGIVLGAGGNPLHWGVANWPFNSVARLWGDGNSPLPIVLVNDCVDAMVRANEVPAIEGDSFNLVGEPCLTAQEYLDELERASGLRLLRVPTSSLRYFVEDVGKYVIKTAGRDPGRKLPSFANWDGRTCAARFDSAHARERLAWQPTRDRARIVREGITVPALEFLS